MVVELVEVELLEVEVVVVVVAVVVVVVVVVLVVGPVGCDLVLTFAWFDCVMLVVTVGSWPTGVCGCAVIEGMSMYVPLASWTVGLMSTSNAEVVFACTLTPPVIVD